MIFWENFSWFALAATLCWVAATVCLYRSQTVWAAHVLTLLGIGSIIVFISGLWMSLERPPLRTMGETRLWYSFFLAAVGYVAYLRWRYKWLLVFSFVVAIVFMVVNVLKPEIHSKNLMPALQSNWFVPHVTAYILSYALLGAATIAAFVQLYRYKKGVDVELLALTDNLVYIGFGLLTLGMLMGAVWAKEAWGHYWSWDPKETWAFITATAYLVYIHLRLQQQYRKLSLWLLPFAFLLLMITWKGVNYLPAAQNSIHVYSR